MKPEFFSFKSPKKKWDVIVIGSGMGGMTTAALLAKAGKQVLILEQHYVPGGFTHTFRREHWEWDVGVHAIGEVTEHSFVGRVLNFLTDGRLKWASLGAHYEEFFFPDGVRLNFPDNPKTFRKNILDLFPDEAVSVDRFFKETKTVAQGMRAYFLGRCLPRPLAQIYEKLSGTQNTFQRTTKSVLDALSSNDKLKTVLSAQWGYHGAVPSRSSFAMQALVTRHYAYGAFYPQGGSSQIARALLQTVAEAGGWTRVRSAVKEIKMDGARACGVVLQNGETIEGKVIVSAVGARETVERLLPASTPKTKAWRASVQDLKASPCHICLHLGFDGDIRKAGASGANQWFWESWNSELGIWDFQDKTTLPPVLYTSYPSLKDPKHSAQNLYHTGEVVTFVSYEDFAAFQETRTQKRGKDYEAIKDDITKRVLKQLFRHMPGLEQHLRYTELSTPLSTEHYTRSFQGAIYGLEPTPKRFRNSFLRPQTPIKNLYMSGTDVGTAGVIGAMVGGVLSAVSIAPLAAGKLIMQQSRNPASKTQSKKSRSLDALKQKAAKM